jgi:hypothetical protein
VHQKASTHGWVKGGRSGGLHRKAIIGCHEEGVWRRPKRRSTHGWVEGRPGRSTNGGASRGARAACEEEKTGMKVASYDAHSSACGGANDGGGGACGGASGGTRVDCDGGRAD